MTNCPSSSDLLDQSAAVTITDVQQPTLLFAGFNQLRRRQQFCDVELRIREARFSAHQIILAAGSPYLMELLTLSSGYIEIFDPKVEIAAIDMLIEFLYTSTLRITRNTVLPLCYAARLLKLDRVEKVCCKYMTNTLELSNSMSYLLFAGEHDYQIVQQKCCELISNQIKELISHDTFLSLTPNNLIRFTELFKFSDSSIEMEAIFSWAYYDFPMRQETLSRFLPVDLSKKLTKKSKKMKGNALNPKELSAKLLYLLQQEDNLERHAKNTLLAIGGTTDKSVTNSGERYIVGKEEWQPIAPIPHKKSHASTIVVGSKVFSIGGFDGRKRLSSIDIYNTMTGEWSEGPPLHHPRSGCATAIVNRELFIIGGYDGQQHLASVDILNLKTHKWRRGPSLQQSRSNIQAGVLNDVIVVVGGANNEGRLQSVEMLEERAASWVYASPLSVPRSRPGVAVLGNQLYAIGGYDGESQLASVECYDPAINEWSPVSDMTTQRNSPAVTVLQDKIYVAGGYDGRSILTSTEVYDPQTNIWLLGVSMATGRCDFGLVSSYSSND